MPVLRLDGQELHACPEEVAAGADCVVIVTDHSTFDYEGLVNRSRLMVDTRNALKRFNSEMKSGCNAARGDRDPAPDRGGEGLSNVPP